MLLIDRMPVGVNADIATLDALWHPENVIPAKVMLVKLAICHDFVPDLPDEATMEAFAHHHRTPSIQVVVNKLDPPNNAFILHEALMAECPFYLFKILWDLFPQQHVEHYSITGRLPIHVALSFNAPDSRVIAALIAAQVDHHQAQPPPTTIRDPVTGMLPHEMAMMNLSEHPSTQNVDIVYRFLQHNPSMLGQHVLHPNEKCWIGSVDGWEAIQHCI